MPLPDKNIGQNGPISPRAAQNDYSERVKTRKRRKAKPPIKYLTEDEIAALFRAIDEPRDRALFRLAYHHGLRASEVGLLTMTDYRAESGRIMIHRLKGSISAEFRLVDIERKALRAWLRERGPGPGAIFRSRNHRPISRRRLDELMKRYCTAAGISSDKAHFHALKHSCGTHLLERGEHIEDVQDQLGHANIQNTMIYAKMRSKRRDQRADRLRDWR